MIKKIFSFILFFLLVLPLIHTKSIDVNNDNLVNTLDVGIINNNLEGNLKYDINDDGVVNEKDIDMVNSFLSNCPELECDCDEVKCEFDNLELGKCPDLNSDHIVDVYDLLGFGSYVGECKNDENYLPLLDYDNNGCIEYCQDSNEISSECVKSKDYLYFSSFFNKKVNCIFEKGDINYNGIVDDKDVNELSRYIDGWKINTKPGKEMLDLNNDNKVNSLDVKLLKDYIK